MSRDEGVYEVRGRRAWLAGVKTVPVASCE